MALWLLITTAQISWDIYLREKKTYKDVPSLNDKSDSPAGWRQGWEGWGALSPAGLLGGEWPQAPPLSQVPVREQGLRFEAEAPPRLIQPAVHLARSRDPLHVPAVRAKATSATQCHPSRGQNTVQPRRADRGRAWHTGTSRSLNEGSLSQAVARRDLEHVTPGDVSRTQTDKHRALPHVEHLKQPRVTETDAAAAAPSGTSEETQPVSQPRARPRVTWVLAVAWRGVACASPGPPPSPAAHGVAGRVCWPSRGQRRSACPSLVVPGHPASSVVKVPAKAVFKVTQALSHFYLYAKETLCCSLVFKITAFQIFAAKVNNLRFILSMIGKHLKPYLPNRLFLLTNYNQPWK